MGYSPQRKAPQSPSENGVWPFDGCNPAASSSDLPPHNLPPGLDFHTETNSHPQEQRFIALLLPAALASVPCGLALARVRVRVTPTTFLAWATAPSVKNHMASARTASGRLAVAIPPRHLRGQGGGPDTSPIFFACFSSPKGQ